MLSIVTSLPVLGQSKYDYIHFNQLTEVKGTTYVIASIDSRSKIETAKNKYLLFIDTQKGSTTQVNFPEDGYMDQIKQVKIDRFEINKIIVAAKTIDLDNKGGISWSDPKQIFILSVDGQSKIQLTEDSFFTRTWTVNQQTGMIVITGHYDSNENGKYDKTDKNQILIFDLNTLKLHQRI